MTPAEQALHSAICLIEAFLAKTSSGPLCVTSDDLKDLSSRIAQTRLDRGYPPTIPAELVELRRSYHDRLLLLRRRLTEIETSLATERERLAEEHRRVTRVREWHSLLTSVQ